jgi:hypothetical protein
MKNSHRTALAAASMAFVVAGCAATHPTLYPNDQYQRSGKAQAERDVEDCEARAEDYVKTGGQGAARAAEAARNTGVGAVVGGAGGAVGGAIYGNPGEGAAVGAASGATAGLVGTLFGWMFQRSEPEPVYRNFVEKCLRDKGYDPIGWS